MVQQQNQIFLILAFPSLSCHLHRQATITPRVYISKQAELYFYKHSSLKCVHEHCGTSSVHEQIGIGTVHRLIFPALTSDARLTWARGKVLTPRGSVEISWRRSTSGPLELNVSVPANSHATVVLPGTANASEWTVSESGARLCSSWTQLRAQADPHHATDRSTPTMVGHRTVGNGAHGLPLQCRTEVPRPPSQVTRAAHRHLVHVDVGSGTFAFTVTTP